MTTRAGTSYSQSSIEELRFDGDVEGRVDRQEEEGRDGSFEGRDDSENGTRAGGDFERRPEDGGVSEVGRNSVGYQGRTDVVEMMMRTLLEDRRRHEAELAEERRRWEEERRKREWEFEEQRRQQQIESARREEQALQQMQVLQALVEGVHLQGEAAKRKAEIDREVRIPKLTEQDDIVSYLTMFERLMTAFEVKEERWAYKLASCLSGKAQKAYAALPVEEAGDYKCLKEVRY